MKLRPYLFIFVIVLSILIVILSIVLSCDYKEGITLASNFISAFSALITMIIAFLLFDQFGITNRFVNSQTDSGMKLIEKLKTFNCTIIAKGYNYYIPFSRDLNHRKLIIKEKNDEHKKLIFTRNSNEHFHLKEINEFLNDPWLPAEIKEKLKFLEFFGTYSIPETKDFPQDKFVANFGDAEFDECLFVEEVTFIEFIEKIEQLKKEISSWLKKYSSMKLDAELQLKS